MALSSGSARAGACRPKVGDEVGERAVDVVAGAPGRRDGERPDAVRAKDEPGPQPPVGEAEADGEAGDEQDRPEPDEDRPRVAGHAQAAELKLPPERELEPRDGGRD